jgi:hypothetical protein
LLLKRLLDSKRRQQISAWRWGLREDCLADECRYERSEDMAWRKMKQDYTGRSNLKIMHGYTASKNAPSSLPVPPEYQKPRKRVARFIEVCEEK